MDWILQAIQESKEALDSLFVRFLLDAPKDASLERLMVITVQYFVTQLLTRYRRELGLKKAMLNKLQKESLLKPPYRLKLLRASLSKKRKKKMKDLKEKIEELDADLHVLLEYITGAVFDNYRLCNSLQIRDEDEYSSLKYVQSIFPDIVQTPIKYIGDFLSEQEGQANGLQTIWQVPILGM
ncbi:hypothetical protein SLE2022_259760 [Rubroshorea leprosula]